MKKLLLSLAAVALASSAMAESVTLDFVNNDYGMTRYTSGNDYNANPTTVSEGVVSVTFDGGNNRLWSDGIRMYSGSKATINIAEGNEITAVTYTTTGDSSFSGAFNDNNEYVIKYTATSKNKAIKTITVEYKTGTTVLEPAGLAFENESYSAELGTEFTAPVLANPNNLAVSYTSSDESVATVDAEGNVTLVAAGKTVITASSEATDEFRAGEATYTLVVVDPNAPVVNEVIFDFVNNDYGMTRRSGNTGEYNPIPTTIKEGDVTIVLDGGNNRLWADGLRMHSGATATITVADGYKISDVTYTATGTNFSAEAVGENSYVIKYTATSKQNAISTLTVKYEQTTAVETIEAADAEKVIFDLNGRRVSGNLEKGIYVVREGSKSYKLMVK